MANAEQGTFVFCVVFIVIFASFLGTMPTGLSGQGGTAQIVIPVNPALVTDFTDYENYTKAAFAATSPRVYTYDDLGSRNWIITCDDTKFALAAYVYVFGVFWLGQFDVVHFKSPDNIDRGNELTLANIAADATDGEVRYELTFDNGNSAGAFVVYWNTTVYSDPSDAWDNSVLYLVHGVGIASTVGTAPISLLLSVLFLQLPDVPVLLGLLVATPPWACILFLAWFIIKESLPFV